MIEKLNKEDEGLSIQQLVDKYAYTPEHKKEISMLRYVEQNHRPEIRTFETGATRNTNTNKYDYSGFNSPLVMKEYARYMHGHRLQADGSLRSSRNWQKGISYSVYMESMFRHFYDVWAIHEGNDDTIIREDGEEVDMKDALCGLLFNVNGYLHELLKENVTKV